MSFQDDILADVWAELMASDVVVRNVGYRSFVSRSKGWRNGQRRVRERLKQVELIRYQSGWHYPRRSKLDEVGTEIECHMGDDDLLWYIRRNCGTGAGSQTPSGIRRGVWKTTRPR